jgi:dTDP-4-dehydrorhamnose 3,5-epimerase-like enzyme
LEALGTFFSEKLNRYSSFIKKKKMFQENKYPQLIKGGIHTDERGQISFVNDLKFDAIERFYIISNSAEKPLRAWQGHKIDNKYFYCMQGVIKVHYVKIDDWESPSRDLKVESVVLSATESIIFHIPEGYANAIESLEVGSKLISFSTLPLNRTSEDDVRFESDMWSVKSLGV